MKEKDLIEFAKIMKGTFKPITDNVMIQCPFAEWEHAGEDEDPSMSLKVNDHGDSFFHCFGCKTTGTSLDEMVFRLEHHGYDPAKARLLHDFIEKAEKNLDEMSTEWEDTRHSKPIVRLDQIPSGVTVFEDRDFINLFGSDGYCDYLENERGVSHKTSKTFGIGYDDRFNRVVLPVRWHTGEIVGAVGRAVAGYDYYNYWKFPRRLVLFGEHLLRREPVILTEGAFDCMATHQAGFNAVASLGTEVASEQYDKLVEWGEPVITFFDGDKAGADAAEKVRVRLTSRGVPVTSVFPPDEQDPGKLDSSEIQSILTRLAKPAANVMPPTRWE